MAYSDVNRMTQRKLSRLIGLSFPVWVAFASNLLAIDQLVVQDRFTASGTEIIANSGESPSPVVTTKEFFLIADHLEQPAKYNTVFMNDVPATIWVDWIPVGVKRTRYLISLSQEIPTAPLPSKIDVDNTRDKIAGAFGIAAAIGGVILANYRRWNKLVTGFLFFMLGLLLSMPIADRFLKYRVYIDNASTNTYVIRIGSVTMFEMPPRSHVLKTISRGTHKVTIEDAASKKDVASYDMILDDTSDFTYVWNLFGQNTYNVMSHTYERQ